MIQRRSHRTAPRSRSLAVGGALAALAVVGGTVAAVNAPSAVDAGDIRLAQNAADQASPQDLPLGTAINLDLEPVVAQAAGGAIPAGTTVQVTGLPDGLTQDGWIISGTPTRAGEYEVLVTVSNSGVSRSEKVAIAVTDDAGEPEKGTTSPTTATASPSTTTTNPSTTTAAQPEPTLSARQGTMTAEDDTLGAGEGGGTEGGDATGGGAGDDGEVGTAPDLCAALGDGQMDGASLAQLLPVLVGGDESESSGLAMVLINTVVNLLPSVLGEGGSVEDLGSAGKLLCTISPSLLGGPAGGAATTDKGTTPAAPGENATTPGGATTGAAALDGGPAALLGLLTTGAGSLGQ